MPDIHQKIHNIQRAITFIEKGGVGPESQGGYKFLGIEQILPILKPHLDTEGVIVVEKVLHEDHEFHLAGAKGNPQGQQIFDGRVPGVRSWQYVRVSYEFVAVSDGSSLIVTTSGEGFDTQDKAVKKALTAAYKEAIVRLFSIITNEPDPEHYESAERAEQPAAPEKLNRGQQMADASRGVTDIPKPVEAEKPPAETESAGPIEDTPDALKAAKTRLRKAVADIGESTGKKLEPADVNQIGTDVVGKPRDKWINSSRDINKIAEAIEHGQLPSDPGEQWNEPAS